MFIRYTRWVDSRTGLYINCAENQVRSVLTGSQFLCASGENLSATVDAMTKKEVTRELKRSGEQAMRDRLAKAKRTANKSGDVEA